MLLFVVCACAVRKVELDRLGVHEFVVMDGEPVKVEMSCEGCLGEFLVGTNSFEYVRLNEEIELTDAHFLFDGTEVNMSVVGTKEVGVKVWAVPQDLCRDGASAFAINSAANVRLNFSGSETSGCVFSRNEYNEFQFSQFYNANTHAVTYVYTNSSLSMGAPYMASDNVTLVNIVIDEPFFFAIQGAVHGGVWSLESQMLRTESEQVCAYSESPRMVGTRYNGSLSGHFEYFVACEESRRSFWLLLGIGIFAGLVVVVFIVLIARKACRRRANQEPAQEDLNTLCSKESYTDSKPQAKKYMFPVNKKEENIIFFQRASARLTPPADAME